MDKKINYSIDNKTYDVIFTDNILYQLNSKFSKIKSYKKICLVYDEILMVKLLVNFQKD